MINLLLGVLAAILLLVYLRHRSWAQRRHSLAIALFIAALIYVGFGVYAQSAKQLVWELGGLIVYTSFAFMAFRGRSSLSFLFLVIGWILHAVWDVYVHAPAHELYAPSFYPDLCLGFDLIIAGYAMAGLNAKENVMENTRKNG